MIKRSTGFFKIAFFVFCLFIAFFLISFSLSDIRNYVTAEMCIFSFCVSITIVPLVLEWIVYALGIVTKGIVVSSKEETISYKSMKNSQVPYTKLNDNGTEKMMFFCDKGKIVILSSANTKIHWSSEKDEIHMKTQVGECFAVFKSLYGTKYDNVECEVYTVLPDLSATKETFSKGDANVATQPVLPSAEVTTPQMVQPQMAQAQVQQTQNVAQQQVPMETTEEFEYVLKETDTLFEETINI